MNGQERLIATLIEGNPIWDLAGPQGRAIQRDDDGREVTLLMASKEDAEAIKQDAY